MHFKGMQCKHCYKNTETMPYGDLCIFCQKRVMFHTLKKIHITILVAVLNYILMHVIVAFTILGIFCK